MELSEKGMCEKISEIVGIGKEKSKPVTKGGWDNQGKGL